MKNLSALTDSEVILAIYKCDKEITKLLSFNGTQGLEVYPGAIMSLGDFYVEKYILLNELLLRKTKNDKSRTP